MALGEARSVRPLVEDEAAGVVEDVDGLVGVRVEQGAQFGPGAGDVGGQGLDPGDQLVEEDPEGLGQQSHLFYQIIHLISARKAQSPIKMGLQCYHEREGDPVLEQKLLLLTQQVYSLEHPACHCECWLVPLKMDLKSRKATFPEGAYSKIMRVFQAAAEQTEPDVRDVDRQFQQTVIFEDVERMRLQSRSEQDQWNASFVYHSPESRDIRDQRVQQSYLLVESVRKFVQFSRLVRQELQNSHSHQLLARLFKQFSDNFYKAEEPSLVIDQEDVNLIKKDLQGGSRSTVRHASFKKVSEAVSCFIRLLTRTLTELFIDSSIFARPQNRVFRTSNIESLACSLTFNYKSNCDNIIRVISKEVSESKAAKLFKQNSDLLRTRSLEFFHVPIKFQLRLQSYTKEENRACLVDRIKEPYERAIAKLRLLDSKKCPLSKLKLLVEVAECIYEEVRQFFEKGKEESPLVEPDAFLPIFIYVLLQSRPNFAYQQMEFIKRFMPPVCELSISGYYSVTFEAAIEYIVAYTE